MPEIISRSAQDAIRVLIVDERGSVRSSLRFFLLAFEDLELVGEAQDADTALELCVQTKPDVVLIDVLVPGADIAATIRAIRDLLPSSKVLALTSFQGEELARHALEAGASGHLLKNVSADELVYAIRTAHVDKPTAEPGATAV